MRQTTPSDSDSKEQNILLPHWKSEERRAPFPSIKFCPQDACSTSYIEDIRYKLSFKSSNSMKKTDDVCSGEGRWSGISPDSLCHREGMSPPPSSVNPPPSFLPSPSQHVNAIRNPISPNRFAVKLTGMAVKREGTMEKKLGTVMLSPGGFRGRHSHLFQS